MGNTNLEDRITALEERLKELSRSPLQTRELRILNAEGAVVGVLGSDGDGSRLLLLDSSGNVRIELCSTPDMNGILINGPGGKTLLSINTIGGDGGAIKLHDKDEKLRAQLCFADNIGSMNLYDEAGESHVQLGFGADSGGASFLLNDPKHSARVELGQDDTGISHLSMVRDDGPGCNLGGNDEQYGLTMHNPAGATALGLFVKNEESSLNLCDRNGSPKIIMSVEGAGTTHIHAEDSLGKKIWKPF